MTPAEFDRLRRRAELLHDADPLTAKIATCVAAAAAKAVTYRETIDFVRLAVAAEFPFATVGQISDGASLALAILDTYEAADAA